MAKPSKKTLRAEGRSSRLSAGAGKTGGRRKPKRKGAKAPKGRRLSAREAKRNHPTWLRHLASSHVVFRMDLQSRIEGLPHGRM